MVDSKGFPEPETSRYVIMFSEAFTPAAAIGTLANTIGAQAAGEITVVSSQDRVEVANLDPRSNARVALSFTGEREGDGPTAVVTPLDPDQLRGARQVASAAAAGTVSVEKEQSYTTMQDGPPGLSSIRTELPRDTPFESSLLTADSGGELFLGVRVARGNLASARELLDGLAKGTDDAATESAAAAGYVETTHTWGLQATGADKSPFDGRDIKLAVLDTGFNFQHPDFQGGIAPTAFASFIAGETASDAHGHGTHTAGTAAGPRTRENGLGFGVANKAQLYIGKVLGDSGTGSTSQILEGIRWALQNGCQVINMSLARRVNLNETTSFSPAYETVAQHALQQRALIIAAAGNFSSRPALTWPVCEPANSPSIMAVGAVDEFGRTAAFSCGGTSGTPAAASVDIAGPGVRVYSSFKQPELYTYLNGTSMAAPHVAGIAALYAQVSPNFRGTTLWGQLARTCVGLSAPVEDVGFGLVRAP